MSYGVYELTVDGVRHPFTTFAKNDFDAWVDALKAARRFYPNADPQYMGVKVKRLHSFDDGLEPRLDWIIGQYNEVVWLQDNFHRIPKTPASASLFHDLEVDVARCIYNMRRGFAKVFDESHFKLNYKDRQIEFEELEGYARHIMLQIFNIASSFELNINLYRKHLTEIERIEGNINEQ